MRQHFGKKAVRRAGNRKGQTFLEYLVMLGVVVAVILAFVNGLFRDSLNNSLTSGSQTLDEAKGILDGANLTEAKNW